MTDIDHKALADAIRADRDVGTKGPWAWEKPDQWPEMLYEGDLGGFGDVCRFGHDAMYYNTCGTPPSEHDARRIARTPDLEAAYLQLADERQSLLDRVKELEAAITSCHGPCGCAL